MWREDFRGLDRCFFFLFNRCTTNQTEQRKQFIFFVLYHIPKPFPATCIVPSFSPKNDFAKSVATETHQMVYMSLYNIPLTDPNTPYIHTIYTHILHVSCIVSPQRGSLKDCIVPLPLRSPDAAISAHTQGSCKASRPSCL